MRLLEAGTVIAAALGAALVLAPRAARAQPPPRDSAAAEALFRDARELVGQGRHAEGCPKFEASFALDPSTGTLLNIAKCHEHDGKLATAWADYTQALVLNLETKGDERQRALEQIAKQALADLAPRVPKLRVAVSRPVPGLRVLRDGEELPAATLGEALPVDPGSHEVRASAPGYLAETQAVVLAEGKTEVVEIALVAEPIPKSGAPGWAWASGAVGVALAGAGVFFLTQDLAAINALRANCYVYPDGSSSCKPGYAFQGDNARKDRSFGLFLGLSSAGVIGIGAAVVGLVWPSPTRKPALASGASSAPPVSVTPFFGPGGGGLVLHGGF